MRQTKYASNGKKDISGLEYKFDNAFEKLQHDEQWRHDTNRKIVINYLLDCKRGKAKSAKRNIKVSKASLYRIMGVLKQLSEKWLKNDFDAVSPEQWEQFYNDMEDNKIKNQSRRSFTQSSKAKNYKTIRKFLKWKYGNNQTYPEFCADWVTTEETPTRMHLTRHEVEKMVNAAGTLKVKTYLMMLFDGGFRAEELANLRWFDVKKPEHKEYYKAHVRAETSKTKKERYVSLWLATDYIDSYRNSLKQAKDEDFLFDIVYDSLWKSVKRLGEKVLKKNISPHILRHSSATYYSSIIKTYAQFCSRYGWRLNSGTAQRYFHSVDDDTIAEQAKDHEIAKFKTDFERLKLQQEQKDREIDQLKSQMAQLLAQVNSKLDIKIELDKRRK